jgi:arylsulfatase A-like enzyme
MKRIRIHALTLIIALNFSCTIKKNSVEKTATKPNFIFIMVDDLGKEWISSYGATEIQTPHIDALAANGITFNNAYSMPQCTPSRVALLTGQYPYVNGWVNHYDVPRWGNGANFDSKQYPSFATTLRDAGYRTCAAGKWQINDFRLEPDAMVQAGFDAYCMWTGYEAGNPQSGERFWDPYIFTKEGSRTYEGEFGPDVFTNFIIDFMKENKEDPMCIYYPMVLTHTPFVHTPLERDVKTNYNKHKAMVRYTDHLMGRLVASLKKLNLDEKTYLIFTTDNGTTPRIIGKRNTDYVQGGKTYLTENGINAPFIVTTPNKLHYTTDALIDFTDIYPTLLELAGLENNANPKGNGYSFADVLKEKKQKSKRDWVLSMGSLPAVLDEDKRVENYYTFKDRIIRDETFKAYVDTSKTVIRIFNMLKDPYETENLINQTEIAPTLEKFTAIVKGLPSNDAIPRYEKTDTIYGNISIAELNRMSEKSNQRKSNMLQLSTEEDFLKHINIENE